MNNSTEYTICCAKLFNNIGCVYFEIGKYEKAMQTFQRALQLFHNSRLNYAAWNAAISDQSSIMNNMAYILTKFKQYDDASDLVDASFELQQIIPGTTNTLTISTLGTMAFIYYRTKKYKLSLDTYSGTFHFCWRYAINQSIFSHLISPLKLVFSCKTRVRVSMRQTKYKRYGRWQTFAKRLVTTRNESTSCVASLFTSSAI